MSTARRILSNTFIQITGKAVTAILSIVIVKIITNFLGVEAYGLYISVYEFLAFFGIVADFGLFTIAVREITHDLDRKDFIFGNIFSLRALLASTMMILAVIVVFLIPKYQGTWIPLGVAIASISLFFSILNGMISSVLQVNLKMQYPAIALILGKIVAVGYMVYVVAYAYTQPSAEAFFQLLWAGVIGNGVMLLFTWFFARRYAKIRFLFNWDYWKMTLWKALPYGAALVLNMVYFRIDSILLFFLRDATEVGIFGTPMRILDILLTIPIYFMSSVLPTLTLQVKHMPEKINSTMQHAFDFLIAVSAPVVAGVQALAYPLIFAVSSPEFLSRLDEGFYGSDIALQILIVAMFFACIGSVFTFTLIALGKQGKLLYISLIVAVINIAANLLIIPHWGFRGAAVVSVLSEILIVILAIAMLRRHLSYHLNLIPALKIVFSATLMGVLVWVLRDPLYEVVQNFNLLILIPCGGIFYAGMLWITGVVDQEKWRLIKGR